MAKFTEKAVQPSERRLTHTSAKPKKEVQRLKAGVDWFFAGILLVLLTIGTIFVYSASYVYAKQKFGTSYYFISRQLAWVAVSLALLFLLARYFDYLILKRFSGFALLSSWLLLWCVFFFGADANGATRWIDLGPFGFQPSEIVKFTVILAIASYVVKLENRDRDLIRTFRYGVLPFGVLAVGIAIPLLLQPHLSATIIILALIFIMMYLSGVKGLYLWGGGGIVAAAMAVVMLFTSHGRARIDNWFHPENDIQGAGWQPLQSRYAIGSGGVWGVGFGASKQKHLYLPEPQNDYIFSVICEEMGFVFAVVVIVLFLLLIWRGFVIAKNAPSKFSSLLVMGIICQIAIQVFLNIAVVSGSIPSTGVSLPFFSYGGTSLLVFMAEMGIVLNVSKYSYREKT